MSRKCPNCQRVLYNRRLKHCGYCGAETPESMRFSAEEVAAVDREMAEWKEQRLQHERAKAKKEEAARRRGSGDPGFYWPGFM